MNDQVFKLTNNSHYIEVREIADSFINQNKTIDELWVLARESKLFYSLAAFLAISKIKIQKFSGKKLRIAILMNLIHEHNRLRPSSSENINGENSLFNKIAQLNWILKDTQIEYQMIYVSGTCPWASDKILLDEISKCGSNNISLLQIEKSALNHHYTKNQKGGEIIFGIRSVLQYPEYPDLGSFDCLLFTDADMTLDLGQIGFLIDGYFNGDDVIIGNRMDKKSILKKNMTRAGTGMLMFRHIQRKLTPGFFLDLNLHDTQCPWKFLSGKVLKDIAMDLDSMDWSIDTDILSAAIDCGYSVKTIAVTAIDSEPESHGKAIGHYKRNKTIIDGIIHQARKYGLAYDRDIAELVEKYLRTDEDYKRLLNSGLPEELQSLPNEEWGRSPLITPAILEKWLRGLQPGNE